jgi:hypothetical protein
MILFFLDYVIGGILRHLYFKQDSGYLYRTTYAMDSTKADILIFGSSTANHHYYPPVFEKRMNMTVYNTGRDGNTVFYNYAVLESILKRYFPKIAILNFDIGEFQKERQSYDRLSSLLPYFDQHPHIRRIIELRGPYEKYKLLSKIYPFNSLIFSIGIGNTDYNRNREYIEDQQGYVPLMNQWNQHLHIDTSNLKYELDSNKINMLTNFIKDCINSNIKLYIFISPRFIKYYGQDQSVEIASKIAKEFDVPFYDYSKDAFFWNHPNLFDDQTHLNDSGARVFSNKVIDDMLHYKPQNAMIKN